MAGFKTFLLLSPVIERNMIYYGWPLHKSLAFGLFHDKSSALAFNVLTQIYIHIYIYIHHILSHCHYKWAHKPAKKTWAWPPPLLSSVSLTTCPAPDSRSMKRALPCPNTFENSQAWRIRPCSELGDMCQSPTIHAGNQTMQSVHHGKTLDLKLDR